MSASPPSTAEPAPGSSCLHAALLMGLLLGGSAAGLAVSHVALGTGSVLSAFAAPLALGAGLGPAWWLAENRLVPRGGCGGAGLGCWLGLAPAAVVFACGLGSALLAGAPLSAAWPAYGAFAVVFGLGVATVGRRSVQDAERSPDVH